MTQSALPFESNEFGLSINRVCFLEGFYFKELSRLLGEWLLSFHLLEIEFQSFAFFFVIFCSLFSFAFVLVLFILNKRLQYQQFVAKLCGSQLPL